MAEKIGEFYYEIKADGKAAINEVSNFGKQASGTLGGLGDMIGGVKVGWAALAAVVAKGVQFVAEAFKEAMESAKKFAVLENSLNKVGMTVKDVMTEIKTMSRTNAVDDDQIAQIINYGVAYQVPKEKLMEFTQATIDYAAQTGKEIPLAMRTMKGAIDKGGAAFDDMARSVAGAGEVMANADGGLKRLDITTSDLKKSFGGLVQDGIKPTIGYMQGVVDWAQRIIDKFNYMRNIDLIKNAPQKIADLTKQLNSQENTKLLMQGQYQYSSGSMTDVQKFDYSQTLGELNNSIAKTKAQLKEIDDLINPKKLVATPFGLSEDKIQKLIDKAATLGATISSKLIGLADQLYAKDPFSKAVIDVVDLNDQFNEMNDQLVKAGKEAQTFGEFFEKMSSGNKLSIIMSAFGAISGAIKGIAQAGNDWLYSMSDAARAAQSMNDLNHLLERYKNNLEEINLQIDVFKKSVTDTDITAADTEEGINQKIAARRGLIDGNSAAMTANQKIMDEVYRKFGSNDFGALRSKIKNMINELSYEQDRINLMPDKVFGIFDNQQKKDDQVRLDRVKRAMEAQLAAVEAAITAKKAIADMDTNNKQLTKEIADLEQKKLDIVNDQLEAQKRITDELQNQTVEEIKNQIATGQLDVQNLGSIRNIGSKLNSVGITGQNRLVTMQGLGVSNADTRRVIIGNVQMPVYNGNNNNIGASAFAAAQFGG